MLMRVSKGVPDVYIHWHEIVGVYPNDKLARRNFLSLFC